jgi:hypothetical protein
MAVWSLETQVFPGRNEFLGESAENLFLSLLLAVKEAQYRRAD